MENVAYIYVKKKIIRHLKEKKQDKKVEEEGTSYEADGF